MRNKMAKVKLKSGDIFQIALPKALGFAYAKYIDLLEVAPASQYPSLLRIYSYRSKNISDINPDFKKCGLLFSPLLVAGIPQAIRKGLWKLIGNTSVDQEEKIIPHYKLSEPFVLLDEQNAKEWFYVLDADKFSKKFKAQYENVKHLETLQATGSELVSTKIAMGLIKEEGKKIEDYFALQDFYEKVYYNEVTKIPIYFRQPPAMQGKAIKN